MEGDLRRHPRLTVELWALHHRGDRVSRYPVTSFSAGGLFLAWPQAAVVVGELLVLELETRGQEQRLRVITEVARCTPQGVGVRITRAAWERLGRLLEP